MRRLLARLAPALVHAARAWARRRAGLERTTVTRPSGDPVVLLDSGGAAPPLVMLHGIGASKDHWAALGLRLKHRLRHDEPDLPGFGESPPSETFSMAALAEAVVDVADALGLGAFHLAGSSMGGRVAAELAVRHPNRVRTLWLLDPAGAEGEQPSEMIEGLLAGRGIPLFSRTPDEYAAAVAFAMRRPPTLPAFALRVLAAESAATYDRNRHLFAELSLELATSPTTEALLRGLPLPTLISWGEEDRVLHPSGADTLAAAIPGATVRRMPGVGHLPMMEAPDRAAADFLAFLDAHPDA